MKKYELTNESTTLGGREVFRIRALKNFEGLTGGVKKGDIGGYVQSEANLSQEGNCWVSCNGAVFDDARVTGDAEITHAAQVHGNAAVRDRVLVCDSATVMGDAIAEGNSVIGGAAILCRKAHMTKGSVGNYTVVTE